MYDRDEPLSKYEQNYDEHIRKYNDYQTPENYVSDYFSNTVNALKHKTGDAKSHFAIESV